MRGRGGAGNGTGSRRRRAAFLFKRCGKSCEAPAPRKEAGAGDTVAHWRFVRSIRVVHRCVHSPVRFFRGSLGRERAPSALPARRLSGRETLIRTSERHFPSPGSAPKGRRVPAGDHGASAPGGEIASDPCCETATPAAAGRSVSGHAPSRVFRGRVLRRGTTCIPRWRVLFRLGDFSSRRPAAPGRARPSRAARPLPVLHPRSSLHFTSSRFPREHFPHAPGSRP